MCASVFLKRGVTASFTLGNKVDQDAEHTTHDTNRHQQAAEVSTFYLGIYLFSLCRQESEADFVNKHHRICKSQRVMSETQLHRSASTESTETRCEI